MNQRIEFMKRLINAAEKLAPNRVPNGDDDMLRIWSEITPLSRYPERVWIDAVIRWGKREGEFLEVGTLERHAKAVAAEWEGIPAKRQALEAHRNARLKARETTGELPPGTTFSAPQTANQSGKQAKGGMPDKYRARLAGIYARTQAKTPTKQDKAQQAISGLNRLDELVKKYGADTISEASIINEALEHEMEK